MGQAGHVSRDLARQCVCHPRHPCLNPLVSNWYHATCLECQQLLRFNTGWIIICYYPREHYIQLENDCSKSVTIDNKLGIFYAKSVVCLLHSHAEMHGMCG